MSKKRIEDAINEAYKVDKDAQKNALEFVNYLQANDVEFEESDSYFWHPKYKGNEVFTINLELNEDGLGASLDTFVNLLPSNSDSWSEREKEVIWANVRPCEINGCGDCSPGITKVIIGKEFNNLCGSFLGIYDPNAETVECMKKLFDGIKCDIDNASHGK